MKDSKPETKARPSAEDGEIVSLGKGSGTGKQREIADVRFISHDGDGRPPKIREE